MLCPAGSTAEVIWAHEPLVLQTFAINVVVVAGLAVLSVSVAVAQA